MTFISPFFWLIIIALLGVFYAIKKSGHKIWFLLLSSIVFYFFWDKEYIVVLFISILGTYFCGLYIKPKSKAPEKRFALIFGVLLNVGLLISFKYLRFFVESINCLLALQPYFPAIDLSKISVVNVSGLSFFSLMNIGYLLDIRNGRILPEKSIKKMTMFVSYFPKLLAGPIERAAKFLPQLEAPIEFDYELVTNGIKLIVWGLFKKLVIANRLALFVSMVYDNVAEFSGFNIVIATYLFAFQIYCDFSGYSDIAIGISQLFGIRLMENFKQPYFANSLSDFWNRWHISLSTWLRDYIFYPVRRSMLRKFRSHRYLSAFFPVMITMLVSGLWHGAAWNFVIWGGLHGFFSFIESITSQATTKLQAKLDEWYVGFGSLLKVLATFHLVCFTWIFFRADSFQGAVTLISRIFVPDFSWFISPHELFWALVLIGILVFVDFLQFNVSVQLALAKIPISLRWTIYIVGGISVLVFAVFEGGQDFIYFKF